MAAVQNEGGYHRENLPTNKYLSRTFQSSVLLTPANTTRRTISTENYLRQIAKDFHQSPHPWGRKNSYGGRNLIHLKGTPTGHDMVIVAKGSQHFGSGMSSTSRGVQVQQLYSITPSLKSNLRSNDEMIPAPTKINLQQHQVDKNYPAEHPFKSHTPKNAIFPNATRTNEVEQDAESTQDYIHPADSPATAPEQTIISKSRGSAYRHESITIPLDSKRKPMTWPQGPMYQVPKSAGFKENTYYPTPKTQYGSSQSYPISKSTSNMLDEVNNSVWKTMYQNDFSRRSKSAVEVNEDRKYLSKEAEFISNLVKNNESTVPCITVTGLENNEHQETSSESKSNNQKFTRPVYNGPRSVTSLSNPVNGEHYVALPLAKLENTPMALEKTGLQRQLRTNHPNIEIPDLRASRNNRKLLFEKRHFIPEAKGTKSYVIR